MALVNSSKQQVSTSVTWVSSLLGQLRSQISTQPTTGVETDESQAALSNDLTGERYTLLREHGLNPLRAEIITIAEYIPISSGVDSLASSTENVSSSSSIGVSSAAKLIELHRQIRSYITGTSSKILKDTYDTIYNKDFILYLEGCSKSNVVTNYKNTIPTTINTIIENIENGLIPSQSFADSASEYSTIVTQNKTNAFLRGIIEYFIYSVLIDEIVSMIGTVASIDDVYRQSWSIDMFKSIKGFNPDTAFTNQEIGDAFKNGTALTSGNIPQSVIGLRREHGMVKSSFHMFANNLRHLLTLVKCKDSISCLEYFKQSLGKTTTQGQLSNGYVGDLGSVIQDITNITPTSMIKYTPGTSVNAERKGRPLGFNINEDSLWSCIMKIKDTPPGENASYGTALKEILPTLSFDLISYFVDYGQSPISNNDNFQHQTAEADLARRGDIRWQLQTYENAFEDGDSNKLLKWLKKAIGDTNTQAHDFGSSSELNSLGLMGMNATNTDINHDYVGLFREMFALRQSELHSGNMYSPLEATQLETVYQGNDTYVDGPSYYIERQLMSGDLSNDLRDMASVYSSKANDFTQDFLTLNPDYRIVGAKSLPSFTDSSVKTLAPIGKCNALELMIDMFENFKNDLIKIKESIVNKDDVYLPMLLAWMYAKSDKEKIYILSSIYWSMIKSQDYKNAYNDFKNDLVDENVKSVGALIEYYCEKVVISALKTIVKTPEMDEANLYNSEEPYNRIMGKYGGHYSTDEIAAIVWKYRGGSESGGSEGATKIDTIIQRKQIDNFFNDAFGGGIELKKIKEPGTTRNVGFYKLFDNTILACNGFGEYLPSMGGVNISHLKTRSNTAKDNNEASNIFQATPDSDANYDYFYSDDAGRSGSMFNYGSASRTYLAFSWIHYIIKRNIFVGTKKATDEDALRIVVWPGQLSGVINGISDAISEARGEPVPERAFSHEIEELAYDDSYKEHLGVLTNIKKRQDMTRDCLGLLAAHADAISSVPDKVDAKINFSNGTLLQKLAMNAINSSGQLNFIKMAGMSTEHTPGMIQQNKKKYFDVKRLGESHLLPNSLIFNRQKQEMMFKVLSESGFGFLENEKHGSKTMLSIGLTNSMLTLLRYEAVTATGNQNFANSPYISVNIYKKDQINDSIVYYPKTYIFDMSANIEDYNPGTYTGLSSHLTDFRTWHSLLDVMQSLEVTRYTTSLSGNTSSNISVGLSGIFSQGILLNHLHDYLLKEYMRSTTGLDISTGTFCMYNDPGEIQDLSLVRNTAGNSELITEYKNLVDEIAKIYPETNEDAQLKSEVFRMARLLRQYIPFSLQNRFEKVLAPKKFDKVYTVFVNEKDFLIPPNSSADQYSIFQSYPGFSVNCKLARRDLSPQAANNADPRVEQYIETTKETAPEVYSYYANITMLPSNFVDGASLITT